VGVEIADRERSWEVRALNRVVLALFVTGFVASASAAEVRRIPCTQSDFELAIADANRTGGNLTVLFNCRDTTIQLDSSRDSSRLLTGSDVVIDGEDRKIVFRMNPPWWDDSTTACAGADCDPDGDGVPDACAEVEGASRFLRLQGNRITLRNLAFNAFWDGVQMGRNGGSDQTLENVSCDSPGDDCVSNPTNPGRRLTVRNSKFSNACDKALQLYGNDPSTSRDLDVTVEGNEFTNCSQPMHAPYAGGRFRVSNNVMKSAAPPKPIYACNGPRFDGSGTIVEFDDNLVTGCRRGLRLGGTVQAVLRSNEFRSNGLRGVAVSGSSRVSVTGNTFDSNGGETSSEAGLGGLSAGDTSVVDAGGGSVTIDGSPIVSSGGNVFLGNRSSSDSTLDVQNLTTATLKAEGNWWGDLSPADQIAGSVDFDPWLTGPPSSSGNPPPSDVQRLRRTDTKPPG